MVESGQQATGMVEYLRLIKSDWLPRLANNWQQPDTLVVLAVVAVLLIVGYFIVRK